MIPEEYRTLIDKISNATEEKRHRWEKTSIDEKFLLNLGMKSVTIYYYLSYPDETPVVAFEILDEYGNKLDGLYLSQEDADFEKMWHLQQAARRNALRIEDTIAYLMSYL